MILQGLKWKDKYQGQENTDMIVDYCWFIECDSIRGKMKDKLSGTREYLHDEGLLFVYSM